MPVERGRLGFVLGAWLGMGIDERSTQGALIKPDPTAIAAVIVSNNIKVAASSSAGRRDPR